MSERERERERKGEREREKERAQVSPRGHAPHLVEDAAEAFEPLPDRGFGAVRATRLDKHALARDLVLMDCLVERLAQIFPAVGVARAPRGHMQRHAPRRRVQHRDAVRRLPHVVRVRHALTPRAALSARAPPPQFLEVSRCMDGSRKTSLGDRTLREDFREEVDQVAVTFPAVKLPARIGERAVPCGPFCRNRAG